MVRFPKGEDCYSEETRSASIVLGAAQNSLKPDIVLIFTKDLMRTGMSEKGKNDGLGGSMCGHIWVPVPERAPGGTAWVSESQLCRSAAV